MRKQLTARGRAAALPYAPPAGVDIRSITVTTAQPDGNVTARKLPIKSDQQALHFMPRSAFMSILEEAARHGPLAQHITILTGASATAVRRGSSSGGSMGDSQQAPLEVEVEVEAVAEGVPATADSGSGQQEEQGQGAQRRVTLRPRLLVGADGMNSIVRAALEDWEPGRFGTTVLPSPSTGLRFKVGAPAAWLN